MQAVTLKIDTVAVTNVPSEVELIAPETAPRRMMDGGYAAVPLDVGHIVRAWWSGTRLAVTAAMAELRTKRNSQVEHTLAFTDPSGVEHTFSVNWFHDPSYRIVAPGLYDRFSVTWYERPS